jgi:hypothetical protein
LIVGVAFRYVVPGAVAAPRPVVLNVLIAWLVRGDICTHQFLTISHDPVHSYGERYSMVEPVLVFAEARGFRAEAERARALAHATSGRLQGELHQIAALYERIADGKDPDRLVLTSRARPPQLKQIRRFSAAWPDE